MKRISALLICALLVVAVFAGCGNSGGGSASTSTSTPAGDGGSTAAPSGDSSTAEPSTSSGKDSMVVALINEPTQLDPQYSVDTYGSLVIMNTHDPLVRRNSAGELVPCLAESWETSDDGLVITFKIRQGVKFQDGSTLTTEDVAFSLNRAINTPQSAIFTTPFKECRVVDDTYVELELLYADIAAVALLNNGNNNIVSKAIVESVGDANYANNICGTGPYKFKEWVKGSKLTFEAFEDYWDGAPKVKNLELRILKEATTQMVALQTGDVDQVLNLGAFDYRTAQDDPNLETIEMPSTTIWSMGFNCEMEPVNNPTLRKALALAVNKQEVIDGAVDGSGFPAYIGMPDTTQGHPGLENVTYNDYDLEAAKALLAEAGYPEGAGLPTLQIYVREDQTKKVGEVIQSQWAAIGVQSQINVMERSAMIADMDAGKLMVYTVGNVSLTGDASFLLGTLYSPNIPISNYNFYRNAQYDTLYDEQALLFKDPEGRKSVIAQMLNIEMEESPRVMLYFPVSNTAFNKDLYVECFATTESYNFGKQYWK